MTETTMHLSSHKAARGHLELAKRDVAFGEAILERANELHQKASEHYRSATEHVFKAQEEGATQREIAKFLGKSPAWVNGLLRWRKSGYHDTPFGPDSKASRERARVQAAERCGEMKNSSGEIKPDERVAVPTRVNAGVIGDAETESQGERATNIAERGDTPIADGTEEPEAAKAFTDKERAHLIESLTFLAAKQPHMRAKFASKVEKLRAGLRLTWDELLVAAHLGEARAPEAATSSKPQS